MTGIPELQQEIPGCDAKGLCRAEQSLLLLFSLPRNSPPSRRSRDYFLFTLSVITSQENRVTISSFSTFWYQLFEPDGLVKLPGPCTANRNEIATEKKMSIFFDF